MNQADSMAHAQHLLAALHPDDQALTQWLYPRIDDALLAEIAAADYGSDQDQHYAALLRIRDAGVIFAPMEWEPREVLELIRWSDPSDPTWKPGRTGTPGHMMRAFACTALLRASVEPANQGATFGENPTVYGLVASTLALGPEACDVTLRFLSWCLLYRSIEPCERPFFALGLLLVASVRFRDTAHAHLLCHASAWLVAEEAAARAQGCEAMDTWLFGLGGNPMRDDAWRKVAWQVLMESSSSSTPDAEAALQAIMERLLG